MWFTYGLLSAFISGASITLNKYVLKNSPASLTSWALFTFNLPFLAIFAFNQGIPQINHLFLIGVFGSAVPFAVAKTLSLLIIKQSSVSKIIPLNAFSSVVTYLSGLLLLQENLRFISVVGIFTVTAGAYALNAQDIKGDLLQPFKVLLTTRHSQLFLLAIFVSGVSAVFDKLAVVNTFPSNPGLALFAENLIISPILLSYLVYKKKSWVKDLTANFWPLVSASLVYGLAILMLFWGLTSGTTALVISVKKLQILFAILLSFIFLKDKPSKFSIIASILMISGAILIKLE